MGSHNASAEFVYEISNGFIISGGYDKQLNIYNEDFKKIIEIKDFQEWPSSIYEIEKTGNEKKYEIIVNCRQEIYFIVLDLENLKFNINKKGLRHISNITSIEMEKNCYIIAGETGVYYFSNLGFETKNIHRKKILDKAFKYGIKIDNNIIALTSNKILFNGEDELIFYNFNTKKIVKTINNYSFINSVNGLYLMKINIAKNILLCACQKYFPNQKNGILLVNPEVGKNDVIEPFYDTGEFEVFCFCQIYINQSYTNYFFVGGFDIEKREGGIKLYQLICDEETSNAKIEFVLDIVIEKGENIKGIEKPINGIIQSKKKGNIIVSSWDGNTYLFTPPNLNFFLFNDTLSKTRENFFSMV